MKQRKTPNAMLKLRRWAAAGVAASIAIVWTVSSLISPSLAETGGDSQPLSPGSYDSGATKVIGTTTSRPNHFVPSNVKLPHEEVNVGATGIMGKYILQLRDANGNPSGGVSSTGRADLNGDNGQKYPAVCIDPLGGSPTSTENTGGYTLSDFTEFNKTSWRSKPLSGAAETNTVMAKKMAYLWGDIMQSRNWNDLYNRLGITPDKDKSVAETAAAYGVHVAFWSLSGIVDVDKTEVKTQVLNIGGNLWPAPRVDNGMRAIAKKMWQMAAEIELPKHMIGAAGTLDPDSSVGEAGFSADGKYYVVNYTLGNSSHAGKVATLTVTNNNVDGLPEGATLVDNATAKSLTTGSKVTLPASVTLTLPANLANAWKLVKITADVEGSQVTGTTRIPIDLKGPAGYQTNVTVTGLPTGAILKKADGSVFDNGSVLEFPTRIYAEVPSGQQVTLQVKLGQGTTPEVKSAVSVMEQSREVDAEGNMFVKIGITGSSDSGTATLSVSGTIPAGGYLVDENGAAVGNGSEVALPTTLTLKVPAGSAAGTVSVGAHTEASIPGIIGEIVKPSAEKSQWLVIIDGQPGGTSVSDAAINVVWSPRPFPPVEPEIGTTATSNNKKTDDKGIHAGKAANKLARADRDVVITDVVRYDNVESGQYNLKGELKWVNSDNTVREPSLAEVNMPVKPVASGTGEWTMTFPKISADKVKEILDNNGKLVVFEYLSNSAGKVVAEHANPADEGQTIYPFQPPVPTLATTASLATDEGKLVKPGVDSQLIDVVDLNNLEEGETYTLKGYFVKKGDATATPVTNTVEESFVAGAPGTSKTDSAGKLIYMAHSDGSHTVVMRGFNLPKSQTQNPGDAFVAFEELYHNTVKVAEHKDPNDINQTISVDKPEGVYFNLKKTVTDESIVGGKTMAGYQVHYDCSYGTGNAKQSFSGDVNLAPDGPAARIPTQGTMPVGTTCTLAEVAGAAEGQTIRWRSGPSTAWSTGQSYVITSLPAAAADQPAVEIELNNYYTDLNFGMSITKNVEVTDPANVLTQAEIEAKEFKFEWTCKNPKTAQVVASGIDTIKVKKQADGTYTGMEWVKNPATGEKAQIPQGSVCDVREITEDGAADFANFSRETWVGSSKAESVSGYEIDCEAPCLTFTNKYEGSTGGFRLNKQIAGDLTNADIAASFNFDYTCTYNGKTVKSGSAAVSAGQYYSIQGVPVGATCNISEATPVPTPANYDLSATKHYVSTNGGSTFTEAKAPVAIEITEDSLTSVVVRAENTYAAQKGKFTISKQVEGETSQKFFDFTITCGEKSWQAKLQPNATWTLPEALPLGTTCTVEETTTLGDNYNTGKLQWTGADAANGASVSEGTLNVTIGTKDQNPTFVANNVYTPKTGGFEVTKTMNQVEGVTETKSFNFSYTCTDRNNTVVSIEEDQTFTLQANGVDKKVVTGVPKGATCYVTEENPEEIANHSRLTSWKIGTESFTGETVSFKVDNANTLVKVQADNAYTPDEGGFTIKKTVDAGEHVNVPANKAFRFETTCSKAGKPVSLPADVASFDLVNNQSKTVTGLESGWDCQISEVTSTAQVENADHNLVMNVVSGTATVSGNTINFKTGPGTSFNFTAQNHYTVHKGSLKFTKLVTGDTAAKANYKFSYTCDDGVHQSGPAGVTLVNGQFHSVSNIPVGTKCTITEEDAAVEGYTHNLSWTGGTAVAGDPNSRVVTVTGKDVTATVSATNDYQRNYGKFKLVKKVSAPADVDLSKVQFTFDYTCKLAGTEDVTGTLTATAADAAPQVSQDIPEGATCSVTEKPLNVENLEFAGITWKINGEAVAATDSATFEIVKGEEPEISVEATNTYAKKFGGFTLQKTNSGEGPQGSEFKFTYQCYADGTRQTTVKGPETLTVVPDAPAQSVEAIPYGSVCDIWEDGDTAVYGSTLEIQWTGALPATTKPGEKVSFNIDENTPNVAVKANNVHTPKNGAFQVSKKLVGDIADIDPNKVFTFEYVCDPDQVTDPNAIKTLSVKAGEVVNSPEFAHNTTCFIREQVKDAEEAGKILVKSDLYSPAIEPAPTADGWVKFKVDAEDGQTVLVTATNQYRDEPKIGTTLVAGGAKSIEISDSQTGTVDLVDTIAYENLIAGQEYTFTGRLMAPNTAGEMVQIAGPVNLTQVVDTAEGTVEMTFTVNVSDLRQYPKAVAYETVSYQGEVVATHEDPDDEDQTVKVGRVPEIATQALVRVEQDGKTVELSHVKAGEAVTLTDLVSYKNLTPGTAYVLHGLLVDKADETVVAGVSSTQSFTPTNANDTVEVTFDIPAGTVEEGHSYVVYEWLYQADNDTFEAARGTSQLLEAVVAKHTDLGDAKQTVTSPTVKTNATGDKGDYVTPTGTRQVTDQVTYTNLIVGKTYTVEGELIIKDGSENGTPSGIKASKTFVAAAANGSVNLVFEVPAEMLVKGPFVAFETVYYEGVEVGFHRDITDADQTVYVPEIGTKATNAADGGKYLTVGLDSIVQDTVSYSQLIPGKKYYLVGKLMDKATNTEVVGSKVVEGAVFTASETGSGETVVKFHVPGDQIKQDASYVVFEYLHEADTNDQPKAEEVTKHEDIDDEAQTVIGKDVPGIGTSATGPGDIQNVAAAQATTITDTVSYTNLDPETEYTLTAKLMDKSTGEAVAGVTGTATFTTPAAEAGKHTVSGEQKVEISVPANTLVEDHTYVVFEQLFLGTTTTDEPVAVHEDIEDEAQTVTVPKVRTNATDKADGDDYVAPTGEVTVVDRVTYTKLIVGKEYTVTGKLMNKNTGQPLMVDGAEVTQSVTFTAEQPNGSVDLEFTIPASALVDGPYVAFEKIYHKDIEVGSHEDLTDADQTVYQPKIGTTATDANDGDKFLLAGEKAVIKDVVSYEGLKPNTQYRLEGTLMDKATAAAVAGVTSGPTADQVGEVTFTTDASGKGSVEMFFQVLADQVKEGHSYVVFEKVFEGASKVPAATHEDIEDEAQTVRVPKARTNAAADQNASEADDNATVTVTDIITYSNLIVGKTYTVDGELMFKDTGESTGIKQTVEFVANSENGFVKMDFEVPAKLLKGRTVVAFETVKYENRPVAVHQDLTDEDQSVYSPSVKTSAHSYVVDESGKVVTDRGQFLQAGETVRIVDTVTYTGLATQRVVLDESGKAKLDESGKVVTEDAYYTVVGTLMDAATSAPVSGVTSQPVTFHPTTADGSLEVTYELTVPAELAQPGNGATYVVFEELREAKNADDVSAEGKVVASHQDYNDVAQTLAVPSVDTNAEDDLDGDKYLTPKDDFVYVKDIATYTNLIVGKEYTFSGTLHYKSGPNKGQAVPGVSAEQKFTPQTAAEAKEGAVTLVFKVPAELLRGETVVAFEKVTHGGVEVGSHTDLEDDDQTVYSPLILTKANDKADNDQVIPVGVDATIADEVTYSALIPGATYTVVGTLMDANTGKAVSGVDTVTHTFQAADKTAERPGYGSETVEFTVPASVISAGSKFVVFQKLYEGEGTAGKNVANHELLESTGQTVVTEGTPSIGTSVRNGAAGAEDDLKVVEAGAAATLVDTVSYTNLTPGTEYVLSGKLMKKTGTGVEETGITASQTFTPNAASGQVEVTFTVPADQLVEDAAYVVFETLTQGDTEIAKHEDPEDPAQTVTVPKVTTDAKDLADNDKYLQPGAKVQVKDLVTYTNLQIGKEYTVKGVLMNKNTGEPLVVDGKQVTASDTFTAEQANGTRELVFEVPASALVEGPFVVFEKIYYKDIPVGSHEDITDDDQTVYAPKIGTTAVNATDLTKFLATGADAVIEDTVTYTQLIPGKDYTLTGKLVDKSTCTGTDASTCAAVPGAVAEPTSFQADASGNGSVVVKITVPAASIANNGHYVVFEYLHEGTNPQTPTITEHEDPEDEDQTVIGKGGPEIGTSAVGESGIQNVAASADTKIVDTVSYTNLEPETEYTVTGILMDKSVGAPVEGVTGQATFTTPAAAEGEVTVSGTVTVEFAISAGQLVEDHTYVVFEKLYLGTDTSVEPVTVHEDINDAAQTVYVPKVTTDAKDLADGDEYVAPTGTVKVTDQVTYTNLIVGKEYTVSGKLMNKNTNEPLVVDGAEVTQSVTFTAEQANGTVDLVFEVPASALVDGPYVAFEKIYHNDIEVGAHEDITDGDQTVYQPKIGTVAVNAADQTKFLPLGKDAVIEDTVTYSQLVPGKTYTLSGKLVDKSTCTGADASTCAEVAGAVAETTKFVADASGSGSVIVKITVPAEAIKHNSHFVVFEYLHDSDKPTNEENPDEPDKPIAEHENPDDEDQTVVGKGEPAIGTVAVGPGEIKNVVANKATTITDTVTYASLEGGEEYVLQGTLMDKFTGEAVEGVSGEVKFTAAESGSGKAVMVFEIGEGKLVENHDYVVFEKLYRAADVTEGSEGVEPVATHEDIDDAAQTVYVPKVTTDANDLADGDKYVAPEGTVSVVDTVTYENLIAGKTYRVEGTLMNQKTGEPLVVDGQVVKQTAEFTPTEENATKGTIDLVFEVPASALVDGPYVAFETLYHQGIEVGSHHDITDEKQTVYQPNIKTSAVDGADSDKTLEPNQDATIVDTVTYTQLVPGKTYTLTGTLMDKATGKPVVGAQAEPVTFTVPTSGEDENFVLGSGTQQVTFTVPASSVNHDATFVVFETLTEKVAGEDRVVVEHHDINDVEQSVVVPSQKFGQVKLTKKLAGSFEPVAEREFNFDYTCEKDGVAVSGGKLALVNGSTEVIGELPLGTVCKFTEDLDGAKVDVDRDHTLNWTINDEPAFVDENAPGSVMVTIEQPDVAVAVVAINTYTDKPALMTQVAAADESQLLERGTEGWDFTGLVDEVQVLVPAEAKVTDTVSWSNVPAGDYVLLGELHEWGSAQGLGLQASEVSIAEGETSGTFTMEFVAPKADAPMNYTVYQSLYRAEDTADLMPVAGAKPVADHSVMFSLAQTFAVPVKDEPPYSPPAGSLELRKQVSGSASDQVTDMSFPFQVTCQGDPKNVSVSAAQPVKFTDIPAGTKCTISEDAAAASAAAGDGAKWMLTWTGEGTQVEVDPSTNTATVTVPEVGVDEAAPALVVVARNNYETPDVPTAATFATAEGAHTVKQGDDAEIVDNLHYTGLTVGETYTVQGTLMNKVTGAPVEGVSTEAVTFVPEASDGVVQIHFHVPAAAIVEGHVFVVFEKVYSGEVPADENLVVTHEDINDAAQTVNVKPKPPVPTPPPPEKPNKPWTPILAKTGSSAMVISMGSMILVGVGIAIMVGTYRRRKN